MKTKSHQGNVFVVSAPSGAGKTSLVKALIDQSEGIAVSISHTTRSKRPAEIDGKDYHFISEREFEIMRDNGGLLEWAEVHGNYYGTPFEPVQAAMDEGRDMLFDVDWQGALQMFEAARADIVSVFILPPSMEELRSRLIRRAEDTEEVINKRLENSRVEMQHWDEYDYPLINDDLDACFADVKAILRAERMRRERRAAAMSAFVGRLLK